MSTLRLIVNLHKIADNARKARAICGGLGMEVMGVTKGVCGDPEVARALLRGGLKLLGDARLDNIRRMRDAGIGAPLMLIRSPAPSEVADCVAHADGSLNGDIGVLRALSAEAVKAGKTHDVVLMADLDTGREGFRADELPDVCREVAAMRNLELRGLGLYIDFRSEDGFVVEAQKGLVALARKVEAGCGLPLPVISGGSTNVFRRVLNGKSVPGITQLRIGTAILLGLASSVGPLRLEDFNQDTFVLEAELIEVKERNHRQIGILSLGSLDAPHEFLFPASTRMGVMGATSDHTLVDLTDLPQPPGVGGTVSFQLGYAALSRLMASPYVRVEHGAGFR